jgi:hypothetical protein
VNRRDLPVVSGRSFQFACLGLGVDLLVRRFAFPRRRVAEPALAQRRCRWAFLLSVVRRLAPVIVSRASETAIFRVALYPDPKAAVVCV